jgi:clan AA aspartic protease (TIGR02281 family)
MLLSFSRFAGRAILYATLLLAGIAVPNGLHAADEQDETAGEKDSESKSESSEKGSSLASPISLELKVSGTNAVVAAERDLSRGLTEVTSLKRKVKLAVKPVRDLQQEINVLENRMIQAEQQLVGLNAQLANVNDVASNNRLVGAINTLEGQLSLAKKSLETLKEKETAARAALNKSREDFVLQVLDLSKLSTQIDEAYTMAAENPEMQESFAKLKKDSGKDLKRQPSSSLTGTQRKLQELEESIQTEKATLRREGNTFFASVVVNGKHTQEMVVDTGASMISLPYEMAVGMGLKPEANDKQILLTIADGSTITAHLKVIDSVRVGTFTAEKVQCAVLGPEAVNAEPLLGMSFLGEFQFNLDAAEGTLGLTQIESDGAGSRKK